VLDDADDRRRRGTGKWAQSDVPHRGWTCVDVEDLGEPSATCEMCEVMRIRYVHHMEHLQYDDVLRVGCVCAEHMEGDYVGPRRREAALKNRLKRRQRFVDREWNRSRAGNEYLNVSGFNVVVFPRGSGWSGRVENRETGETIYSQRYYSTSAEVKAAAFDLVAKMSG
jgi:hypothetical protein